MGRYLKVYKTFFFLNFARYLEYRANFINSTISSVGWGIFSVVVILLLTAKVSRVFGWTRDELLVLSGCVNIFYGLFRGMFSGNFENMSILVKFGKLDEFLTKPIDSQFLVSTTYMTLTGLFRVALATIFVGYMLQKIHISTTPIDLVLFVFLLAFSILLLYSIWYSVLVLTIWHPDLSNIVGLMNAIDNAVRYPQEMYRTLPFFWFLLVLPFTYVVAVPTKVLLHKVTAMDIFGLVSFAIIFFFVSRLFWKFALRSYTSASS